HALLVSFLLFTNSAPTSSYPLSLHDALPISRRSSTSSATTRLSRSRCYGRCRAARFSCSAFRTEQAAPHSSRSACLSRGRMRGRSEEHTSELQSRSDLVCRLQPEKKKKRRNF